MKSEHNAVTKTEPSASRGISKILLGNVTFEPMLEIVRIPACPNCASPNPKGLSACPVCNHPAPPKTDRQQVSAVIPKRAVPWHAKVMLYIGGQLFRLAKWIERS